MSARPIVPGHSYHVHGSGLDLTVIAANGADAIFIAIDHIKEPQQ